MFYEHHGEGSEPRRVVVTGAAGFIGSHLVDDLLTAGCRVTGIDNFDPWYEPRLKHANLCDAGGNRNFSLVAADLTTLDLKTAFESADVVFHLAARPGVQDSWGAGFAEACSLNIALAQRVLEAATSAGVRRVVYASSSSVYGDSAATGTRTIEPISPYGVSKAAGEQLTRVYGLRGLDVVSLRYFTVFGQRQRPDMAMHRLFRAAKRNEPERFTKRGSGDQQREFTFVSDVATATRLVGLSDDARLAGQTFDIGGGCTTSLNEVIDTVSDLTGLIPLVVDDAASPGDPQLTVADTGPIEDAVGWRPSTTLRDGLRQQWEWQSATTYSGWPLGLPLATGASSEPPVLGSGAARTASAA